MATTLAAQAPEVLTIPPRIRDVRTEALAAIIQERTSRPMGRMLVAGCGSGLEAAVLSDALRAEVIGIDLKGEFDPAAAAVADLRRGDATGLEFADRTFDFVYSYHVLEHIPDSAKALLEMNRVLAAGGGICIGTPNRLRLVGYVGGGATWRQRLEWNIADWKARLQGRFRNELGAHAGFSSGELRAALERVFDSVEDVTLPYYLRVYRNHTSLMRLLDSSGLGRFLFPAIYFFARGSGR